MADTLATASDLNTLLGVTLPVAQSTLLLEMATGVIQAAVGQRIVDVTDTAVVDVDENTVWLELPQYPIRSIGTVKIDGVTVTDAVLRKQKVWRALGWVSTYSPPSQATIVNTHGFPAGSQYLQLARTMCLSLAAAGYSNPTGVTSEKIDDYQVNYAEALARMELTPYMRDALIKAYGRSAFVTDSREECW